MSLDPDSGLRRSLSQSQVSKPSQDLLGLSLHPIDPIDPPVVENKPSVTTSTPIGKAKGDLSSNNSDSLVISSSVEKADFGRSRLDDSSGTTSKGS